MKMLTALCLLALTACGSVDAQSLEDRAAPPEIRTAEVRESDTVSVQPVLEYGADVNRGPCKSGYDRIAPGVCQIQSPIGYGPLITGCNSTDISLDIPANAKSVKFGVIVDILTTNATGLKSIFVQFFDGSDTTCTTIRNQFNFKAREFVALASTDLHTTSFLYEFEVMTGKNINIKILESPAGAFGALQVSILGYTD